MHQGNFAAEISNLEKSFIAGDTRTPVLQGINLSLTSEQITFITGPSGCGKTTLISIMAGILSPDNGQVKIFGEIMGTHKREAAKFRLQNIGFIFQQHNLVPTLTACENASIPLLIGRMHAATARRKAREMLECVGLADRVNHLPRQLSGGQQQRVAIARALVSEPRLIICDEPTASLDAENGLHVMEVLQRLSVERSRTVVVVTHDSRIYHFADSVVKMEDGKVVAVERTDSKIHEENKVREKLEESQ
ncbi:MAG: ABC transporter ATP-binding protein [Candidatus Obscuribacterales bacterium]|nr:ABC transporter ATP-binding protein [Candidatus Obscuribacterales bacterium]